MFDITNGKGFHISFANGWTVSVQWGPGNYCDHYRKFDFSTNHGPSKTAEVAIWSETPNGDGMKVRAYQTPEEVARLICNVAARQPVKITA